MEQSNSQVISFLRKKETKLWGFLALMFILILSFVSIQRHTVHIPETIGREVAHAIVHRNGKNYILDNLAQTVRLSIKNFKLNELKVDNILTIAATMLLESDTVFNAYEANINSLLNEVTGIN